MALVPAQPAKAKPLSIIRRHNPEKQQATHLSVDARELSSEFSKKGKAIFKALALGKGWLQGGGSIPNSSFSGILG